MKWLIIALGALATLAGLAAIAVQSSAGLQPWDPELSDNLIFAKVIPFALGCGVLVGALRRTTKGGSQEAEGKIRRFSLGTVVGHWINAAGFVLALITGSWQYLRGIVEVDAPIPLPVFYRVHFIGATLILFSVANFGTYWASGRETSLLVPAGQWLRHLRGLAHELPGVLSTLVADIFGLDMKRTPPPVGQFTYYEKTISFPIWMFAIALITVTGIVKAMRYVYPVPGGVLYWASGLHVAAMVLIAIKLLDHLRYVFGRWPFVVAMCTTWISAQYVRLRHPDWHQDSPAVGSAPGSAHAEGAMAGGSE